MADRLTFPKSHRLLKGGQFDAVFDAKCSAADRMLIIYALPNELTHPRLGLVVSKKVGNAVRRNCWKRLLREAFRLSQHELPPLDLVCLPRFRGEPSLEELKSSLLFLCQKLRKKTERQLAARAASTDKQEP